MSNSSTSNVDAEELPVAVIGACGGVGRELVGLLVRRGVAAILIGRNKEDLQQLSAKTRFPYLVADASKDTEINEVFAQIKERYGPLSGLANCVGSILLKPAHLTSEAEWNNVIQTNLTSAFLAVKHGARAMSNTKGGSIVLVSSAASRVGLPNHEAIAAAKAGVEGLARSAAATYARLGVRVNCVAPGLLDTKLTQSLTSSAVQLQASASMHALGRIGTAKEIASMIDWLLADHSSWVTGQVFAVDGGLSTVRVNRPQQASQSLSVANR